MEKLLGLPELASVHGQDVDTFIIYIHYLMIALFIGWTGYFLYAIWRFRQSRNPKADYVGVTSHASKYLELAVAAVEVLLLLGFAIPLWAKVVDTFPDEKKSLLVRITAQQFSWGARYSGPDGKFGKQDLALVTPTNPMGLLQNDEKMKAQDPDGADDVSLQPGSDIVVPVGMPVITSITSLDVIHSFKVPDLPDQLRPALRDGPLGDERPLQSSDDQRIHRLAEGEESGGARQLRVKACAKPAPPAAGGEGALRITKQLLHHWGRGCPKQLLCRGTVVHRVTWPP